MKLRLLVTQACNRNCEGCCNKDWDLKGLPGVGSFTEYEEILLTGGEPMLYPAKLLDLIKDIRRENHCPIYLYTAKLDTSNDWVPVLRVVDGVVLTFHEQSDVEKSRLFIQTAKLFKWNQSRSLRLNIFKGIKLPEDLDLSGWKIKADMEWQKDCPLPQDEVFMRL